MRSPIEDNLKVYGEIPKKGDPNIRIPGDFTNYLGIHIHDEELERLGIIYQNSKIPLASQIANFRENTSDVDIIKVLNMINPSEVYVPKNGVTKEIVYKNFEKLAPVKVNDYPCGWSELWLSVDYRNPITPQVERYLEKSTVDFYKGYYKKKIKRIKENIINSPLSKKIFYKTENGVEIDLSKLQPGWIPKEDYEIGHRNTVFGCQDIMLGYEKAPQEGEGLVLVVRDNFPAKNVLWPIGGRLLKGISSEESLLKKVKEECDLEIYGKPIYLGEGRTAFQTAPFNHEHGTDTTNERYFAHARGKLKLNDLHKDPIIVKPGDYTPEFRRGLEEYVRDFMDLSMIFVDGMDPILLYTYLNESLLKNKN